jgi:hypothetical protein
MKVKVVVNFNTTEVADPASIVGVAASLIQQSFANIDGVSLVGIVEVADEEVPA